MGPSGCASLFVLMLALGTAACRSDSEAAGWSKPLFTLLPSSHTGVTITNTLPENPARNGFTYEYYYNGAGVAVGDLNGDSLPDLYFTSNTDPNRLYLNRGGLRFEDVTDRAGVQGRRGWATGVTFADVNADRRLDIYVSYSGPFDDLERRRNVLYINEGTRAGVPVFTERGAAYGIDDPGYSTQGAFFDYDRDGDLDLYLLNHGIPGYRSIDELAAGHSRDEVDRLYRNDGGRFVDVTAQAGLIDTNLGFGLGVSVSDLTNDGWPDIYVANDFSGRDYLYLGQPNGRFLEVLERSMGHIPLASMGSDIADLDGDGWLDLAVLEMAMATHYDRNTTATGTEAERFTDLVRKGQHYQYAANALQWNRGLRDGRIPVFSEIAYLAGVARTDWSWAALLADFDNDGRPDLFASNGMAGGAINADFNETMRRRVAEVTAAEGRVTHSLMLELLQNLPRRKVANHAYRNDGDLSFSNRTAEWGLDQPAYSYGTAYADLDRDGDLDLVVNNLMGEAFVYRNENRKTDGAHYLAIQFQGHAGNPFGLGARVRLKSGGAQQVQELQLTRGYQSSVAPVLHFGLGNSVGVDTLEVVWPDGRHEIKTGIGANQYITLDHQNARARTAVPEPIARRFTDAHAALRPLPRHRASAPLADSALQPYPSSRSELALAVGDLNGDALDDLLFGGSRDQPTRLYFQQADGTFAGRAVLPVSNRAHETVAAAIFDADGDGRRDIWVVVKETAQSVHRHQLYLNAEGTSFRVARAAVPDLAGAGVVLAPADYDGDGDQDMFVGNHTVPGAASSEGSHILRNDNGVFRAVTGDVAPALAALRTVTDAVWADIDGNGKPDLLIAGEWLPVTILLNDGARLRDVTQAAGLDGLTGWWQSIAAADFDRDGDIDIVAGNMGLNYPYQPTADSPFELYSNDFDGDGDVENVPAYYEAGKLYPWSSRAQLSPMLPTIMSRYPTHDAFARATLSEILGAQRLRSARRLAVQTLSSTYIENIGKGRFQPRPLPRAAQVSPVTGIVPADFDGDGKLDLVVAGNIYELDANIPRADAGVGLFLRGDGAGDFHAVMPVESGLMLTGAVRRLVPVRVGKNTVPALVAGVAGASALHVRVR
ncbi:MAG: VCBS repeat-containing protein [Gemmatimonadota bacterium]